MPRRSGGRIQFRLRRLYAAASVFTEPRSSVITSETSRRLLAVDDPVPAVAENSGAESPFLLVCDHAGRATPRRLAQLGLPDSAFETHIAWDIGALDLSRRIGAALGACLIHQRYSRLVIDCNREPAHGKSIVAVSDGWEIPANARLTPSDVVDRRQEIFDPYHALIGAEIDAREARCRPTVLVAIHSFTPTMDGIARPWHVGVLHMGDSPASSGMLDLLRAQPGLVVGDNQPYAMDGTDYTVPFHAHRRGADAVELEVRQDLLQDAVSAERIAGLFIALLPALAAAGQGEAR